MHAIGSDYYLIAWDGQAAIAGFVRIAFFPPDSYYVERLPASSTYELRSRAGNRTVDSENSCRIHPTPDVAGIFSFLYNRFCGMFHRISGTVDSDTETEYSAMAHAKSADRRSY